MFKYYFQLGLRSLRTNPALTALMVMAIGFGVAASMITWSVFRATSSNPIPDKSAQLFHPQIDNWGPENRRDDDPPDALNYTDAMALMRAHKATRQTVLFPIAPTIVPADVARLPLREYGYAWYGAAFAMFEVPFLYGGSWSDEQDEARAAVAVIGRELNDELFGGGNNVGRNINLDGRDYRITGIMDTWNPQPAYYDAANNGGFGEPANVMIPFNRAVELQMSSAGNNNCNKSPGNGWDAWLHSDCVWLAFWAELPDTADADAYRQFLEGYAAEQRDAGRFTWPPNVRLNDVMGWLDHLKVVPPESRISLFVSLGFLLICLVNTIGLLLAKFLRRAPEIGVRRALGASRKAIYGQFLTEAGTVGLAGGVLGLVLTGLGVLGVDLVFDPQIARLARLDIPLVAMTLAVAVLATVLAAFYPTWRAAQVQQAWQLKSN
jgi:putative ABC transport system permease protein